MSHISCVIQSEGWAAGLEPELEERLRAHHTAHSGGDLGVSWMAVDQRMMFTAGAPSTTSVISCAIEAPPTRDGREAYMRGVCDLWTDVTGCTDHEIVVAITDLRPAAATSEE